jgi:cellulose biosynthesis protein BcsQ
VLAVDLDAQQNLTASLIGPMTLEEGRRTLYDACSPSRNNFRFFG